MNIRAYVRLVHDPVTRRIYTVYVFIKIFHAIGNSPLDCRATLVETLKVKACSETECWCMCNIKKTVF